MEEIKNYCPECGCSWRIPEQNDNISWWRKFSQSRELGGWPEGAAAKWLKAETTLNEEDIKHMVIHQVEKFGECKRCGASIREEGNVVCEQCGSLNYNFRYRE